jgi:threonine synthase
MVGRMFLRCYRCKARFEADPSLYSCRSCNDPLEAAYEDEAFVRVRTTGLQGKGVWRYQALLPYPMAVSLGEGGTGLHVCDRAGKELGIPKLFVKNEGENPTGSFKDRGMTVGLAAARAAGAAAVGCASTGNTSASMAAYAARAGLKALVLLPAGKVALGKLSQAIAHGARIAQVDGNFDDAMRLIVELSVKERSVYLLNSLNPFRLEGQKTLAFEVCETLGDAPDALVLPMGNAGNISAIWKGFLEWKRLGHITRLPRLIGVQAEKAAPLARAWRERSPYRPVEHPETLATAIRIGSPVSWRKAMAALEESGGDAGTVSDEEILAAQQWLARTEGLFVEPASAVPLAWLRKQRLANASSVVCVTTGHGLKDPDALAKAPVVMQSVRPTLDALRKVLEA